MVPAISRADVGLAIALVCSAIGTAAALYGTFTNLVALAHDPFWAALVIVFDLALLLVHLYLVRLNWFLWAWQRGPRGVHLVRATGADIPCDLIPRGFDDRGYRVWEVANHVLGERDQLRVAMMPPKTAIIYQTTESA